MFDPKTKILVIDDMFAMRKSVIKTCKELGYTDLIEADDGKKGWDALEAAPSVGLILCDWNMPVMSGLELLKKVRSDKRFQKIPFVMVTAEGEVSQVSEAFTAGASSYLVKPVTDAGLKSALESAYESVNSAA